MKPSAPAIFAAALICAFAPAGLAAPQPGLDCACSTVGDYVLPIAAVAPAAADAITGLSPGLKYHVTAVPGLVQAASITVKRVSDGAVLMHDIEAADWGFSPDDDRFVLATISVGGGPAMATLYDLTAVPAAQLHQFQLAAAGSAISFSPHGVYLTDVELEPTPMSVALLVLDARTGTQVSTDNFNFTSAPGDPDDELGAVAIGFGPDATDRTLTYVYVTGAASTQWTTVNLANKPSGLRVLNLQPGPSFAWGFSPCGDAIGIITDHVSAAFKDADVYNTLLGSHLGGSGTFPATDTAALSVTAASHLVTHNAVPEVIASNAAGATCPGPPPNDPPTAAFSAPATTLALLAVQFTDQSTDSDGHVVGYLWDFGDGQGSSLRSPSHAFASTGTFSVTLTVTDDQGATGTVSHSITVSANLAPQAAFSFAPPAPAARDVVTLTDQSTDDDGVVQQDWAIDGVPYSGAVVHARACPPSMAVTLTVYDHAGQSSSTEQVIPVTGGRADIPVAAGANLAEAIAGACPGDRLVLAAGHYAGGVSLPYQISMQGAGMGATFIDGFGSDPGNWALQLSTDLTVSDLTVSGGGVADSDQFSAGGGIRFLRGPQDSLSAHLSGVEVTGNRGNGGVTIHDQARAADISGSRIHHNQRDVSAEGGSAISMFCCASVTVDQTEIAWNTRTGNGGAAFIWEADGVVFTRSDVHDNEGPGLEAQVNCCAQQGDVRLNRIVSNGAGVVADGTIVFAGNLVVKNAGNGLADDLANDLTVVNSTIADNGGIGLFAASAKVWNTIVAGNGTDVSGAIGDGGTNLIGGAPGFVGGGDYHLAAGSPAIDTGTNSAVPASLVIDGDGDPRVLNAGSGAATVDIGWDEATTGWPAPDAGAPDAGAPDAGAPDGGAPDGGAPDAGAPDAGAPDAGAPDAGVDAGADGGLGSTSTSGCGCRTSQASGDLFAWIGAVACFWARRRARIRAA